MKKSVAIFLLVIFNILLFSYGGMSVGHQLLHSFKNSFHYYNNSHPHPHSDLEDYAHDSFAQNQNKPIKYHNIDDHSKFIKNLINKRQFEETDRHREYLTLYSFTFSNSKQTKFPYLNHKTESHEWLTDFYKGISPTPLTPPPSI